MKRGNFTCLIGFVSVILSFFSCDPPETLNVSEMRDELTMLLGNNTTDTIVIIFENQKDASLLYYHIYNEIENDSSFVKDIDDDNHLPFWNEIDLEGKYLHWQIMLPVSHIHVFPKIFRVCELNMTRYLRLPESLQTNPLQAQIGVIKYSDFEIFNHNKNRILNAGVMEHYEFIPWSGSNPENPKDAVFIYNGKDNVVTALY